MKLLWTNSFISELAVASNIWGSSFAYLLSVIYGWANAATSWCTCADWIDEELIFLRSFILYNSFIFISFIFLFFYSSPTTTGILTLFSSELFGGSYFWTF